MSVEKISDITHRMSIKRLRHEQNEDIKNLENPYKKIRNNPMTVEQILEICLNIEYLKDVVSKYGIRSQDLSNMLKKLGIHFTGIKGYDSIEEMFSKLKIEKTQWENFLTTSIYEITDEQSHLLVDLPIKLAKSKTFSDFVKYPILFHSFSSTSQRYSSKKEQDEKTALFEQKSYKF
jgi:hypothetical protein